MCWNQVHELPAPVHHDDFIPTSDDDKMTIAWRYQNMRAVQSSMSNSSFGHHYDLTKPLDAHVLKTADVCYWTGSTGCRQTKGKISPSSSLSCYFLFLSVMQFLTSALLKY
jgi:hypothetical protein